MIVARTGNELQKAIKGKKVGFVPTMGAFHQGHLALMRQARADNDLCVVSLFVNPTQFGPKEDFSKYPRDEIRDFELASSAGCDIIFAPSVDEIYKDSKTVIHIQEVTHGFEGAIRPGHFDGVATVVAKLFGKVGPCAAYFGLKDIQQCAVIQTLVDDLSLPVHLTFIETVREPSGLAMSSRNIYLSQADRKSASQIYASLMHVKASIASQKKPSAGFIEALLAAESQNLINSGFLVDYLALVDFPSMTITTKPSSSTRLICAARLSGVRLLDNIGV